MPHDSDQDSDGYDLASALPAGTVVAGKLRVVRTLGAGGMGAVYEVEHLLTKHRRALKLLHPRYAAQPGVVARFLQEASAAGRIGSAHIIETYDAGQVASGEPYLVMELLAGESLGDRLSREGKVGVAQLARIVRQACAGVQAAHEAGIVHRDLKPDNLFLIPRAGETFVKILDFGISKFDAGATGGLGVTAEGTPMGTPYYMPPEQVRGVKGIDGRADVYALGVILYECACGARPYEAATLTHLAVLIHEGKAVPLAERDAGLPPAFCAVVAKAMATAPSDCFASARELADALHPFASHHAVSDAMGATLPAESAGDDVRIVIRPSAPPITPVASAPASGVRGPATASSDALAMGRTVPSVAPTRATAPAKRRTRVWPAIVGAAMLAGVAGVAIVAASGGGATAVGAAASEPPNANLWHATEPVTGLPPSANLWHATEPVTGLPPSPTVIAATSTATPTATATLTSNVAVAATATATATGNPTPARPAATVRVTASAASAVPAAKTRVSDRGLADENPFKAP